MEELQHIGGAEAPLDDPAVRALLKAVRPDYRFPKGIFYCEDATRVRWLRPEEEVMVLDTIRSPFREIAKLAALTLMRPPRRESRVANPRPAKSVVARPARTVAAVGRRRETGEEKPDASPVMTADEAEKERR